MSADAAEAARCLRELAVPFFHHEVVKQALLLAMEEPAVQAPLLALLAHMAESGLVSGSQMQKACSCCSVLSSLFVEASKVVVGWSCRCGRCSHIRGKSGLLFDSLVQKARSRPRAACPAHSGCSRMAAECHAARLSRVMLQTKSRTGRDASS